MNTKQIEHVIFGWDLDAAGAIFKVCERLNGRKKVSVMLPLDDGRDHDEATVAEKVDLLNRRTHLYSRELVADIRAQLASRGIF